MTRFFASAMLAMALVGSSAPAMAAACPGTINGANSGYASRQGGGAATKAFVGSGANCSFMLVGSATGCMQLTLPTAGGFVKFFATWPDNAARTMDPSGGCSFMCPGGDCFVRGLDGLPVELLNFGVD